MQSGAPASEPSGLLSGARTEAYTSGEPQLALRACPNCGSAFVSAFCAECGERQPSHVDTTLQHLAREAYDEFINIDGRLWRSIVALLTRPGFLAQEYFAGRRSRYLRPFSLFVLLNVFLFFVQPYTGLFRYSYSEFVGRDGMARRAEQRRAELEMSPAEFETRFDDALRDQKKSLLLFAIPVFALVLMVSYAGSGRTYVEHLVFSVHAYAFMVFYMLAAATVLVIAFVRALLLLGVPRQLLMLMMGERGLVGVMAVGMITYLTFGLRRFYHSSWPAAVTRATGLFAVQVALIVAFRDLLFTTVLYSL